MSWWAKVLENINQGDVLLTPGRGLHGSIRSTFKIISKDSFAIFIKSGSSKIPLEKMCFDTLEKAFSNNPHLWLRVAAIKSNFPLENSADKLIRNETGSNLARANYICSILEKCNLVFYAMQGNQKVIKLP